MKLHEIPQDEDSNVANVQQSKDILYTYVHIYSYINHLEQLYVIQSILPRKSLTAQRILYLKQESKD